MNWSSEKIDGPGCLPGDRVRLVHTDDEWTALRSGDEGTVIQVRSDSFGNGRSWVIEVAWDKGSNLSMITAAGDRVEVVS